MSPSPRLGTSWLNCGYLFEVASYQYYDGGVQAGHPTGLREREHQQLPEKKQKL